MTPRPDWWAAFPPISTRVRTCENHQLRWENGALIAIDHPDADAELMLGSLGGQQPDCVRLVRNLVWQPGEDADVHIDGVGRHLDQLRTSRQHDGAADVALRASP